MGFYPLQNEHYLYKKHAVDTDIVIDITCLGQSVISCVVLRRLWHDVIHWISATSYDKKNYLAFFLFAVNSFSEKNTLHSPPSTIASVKPTRRIQRSNSAEDITPSKNHKVVFHI